MKPDNSAHLAAAARRRSEATLRRARETLQRLDRAGEPVTFTGLARAAGVSRSWLYRQPELRAEIDKLRTTPPTVSIPSAERTSTESERRRREAMLAEIQELREENRRLRDEVARRFGQQRADGTLAGR